MDIDTMNTDKFIDKVDELFDMLNDHCGLVNNTKAYFNWAMKGVGFGEFVFYEKDGIIHIDNECMGKDFIKKALCKMVDDAILDS